MVVQCEDEAELIQIIEGLEGQLTGTLIAEKNDTLNLSRLVDALQHRVGRIIYNGVPTGVEVCASMQHGDLTRRLPIQGLPQLGAFHQALGAPY